MLEEALAFTPPRSLKAMRDGSGLLREQTRLEAGVAERPRRRPARGPRPRGAGSRCGSDASDVQPASSAVTHSLGLCVVGARSCPSALADLHLTLETLLLGRASAPC
eukprot:11412503-Alexandrium_andersonii.AAC.1